VTHIYQSWEKKWLQTWQPGREITAAKFSRIAQMVGRRLLDREVRGWNPSRDTMVLLLGRHYEFPQCGIIKGKLSLLIIIITVLSG
jgi:hypothetical protein